MDDIEEKEERYLCRVDWGYKPDTFLSCPKDTKPNSFMITENSDVGLSLIKVKSVSKASEEESNNPDFLTAFPPVLREATQEDIDLDEKMTTLGLEMTKFAQSESNNSKMGMSVVKTIVSLDGRRVLIMYTSPERVDFREFLKTFTSKYHVRLEMRQIGPRDKARIVGGLGVCGLPLCCKTFLTQFSGVTISMAKTQLLSLNVPKLSGQCGKLMCCLGYENEVYKELRINFPKVGDSMIINGKKWDITGINVIADTITVSDGDTYDTYSSANWKRLSEGKEGIEEGKKAIGEENSVTKINQVNTIISEPEELAESKDFEEELTKQEESEESNDMYKNNKRNNNPKGKFDKNNGQNKNHGQGKPGPFGYKPRPQSNAEQAAANPFGFASHNVGPAEVKKEENNNSNKKQNQLNNNQKSKNNNQGNKNDNTKFNVKNLTIPGEDKNGAN